MSIGNEIKNSFRRSDNLAKLIYINLAVFIIAGLLSILNINYENYLEMPSSASLFFTRIWTIFTYMFLHTNFIHLIFNVIFLYWAGRFFLAYFTEKQLVGLYLIGGIFGGIFYLFIFNIFPYLEVFKSYLEAFKDKPLVGASASIFAIITASAVTAPRAEIRVPFIGNIKLMYIAIALIVIGLLPSNNSGYIAHLGGVLTGCLFAICIKKGKDLTAPLNKMIDFFVNKLKRKPKETRFTYTYTYGKNVDYEYNRRKKQESEEIDAILDKIKKSGYDNLTEEEKKRLFEQSQK